MSIIRVRNYLSRIDRLRRTSGSNLETVLRSAFQRLLEDWSDAEDLVFAPELPLGFGPAANRRPDGTVLHTIRIPLGYWEAKDTSDNLDEEIAKKRAVGYPVTNIIFEDTQTAVLFQDGREIMRCAMSNEEDLTRLITAFFAWEPAVVGEWRRAVEQFQADLPLVLDELRIRIDAAYKKNFAFRKKARAFLQECQKTVNPRLEEADIREMLIQHILTENIFARVFDDGEFHRHNNIASQLYALEDAFLGGTEKRAMLQGLKPYYTAIERAATEITEHAEKQTFLKVIYESFYKVYNPDAADRLGVVYTPNEIVRFMIRGTDWLCQEHFGKALIDRGVEILDPATGTGTFVCELLEHFRGQQGIHHKYAEEIHANEVAILPYYVANLNIEATYASVTGGNFAEFENLVFADTLDMTEGLGIRRGDTPDLFGSISAENAERYDRQNRRKISVVIGNPPYNANQQNENDNNKNRTYKRVDERVKATFVKLSTAQKTKVYDMYSRFYRWAFDRMHDEGVVAFVTNRSFIDSRTFDGFRRYVTEEFGDIYVVDLGGDVRANPKLSGTTHNVFGIQTGVCIAFFVKGGKGKGLHYVRRPEDERKDDKLAWLQDTSLEACAPARIVPSKRGNWINQVENEWDDLIPVADKKTKAAKVKGQERAIFKFFVSGIKTNRDYWSYSETDEIASRKYAFFQSAYSAQELAKKRDDTKWAGSIAWSRDLKVKCGAGVVLPTSPAILRANWRPFTEKSMIWSADFNDIQYPVHESLYGPNGTLRARYISIIGTSAAKPFHVLAGNRPRDYELVEKNNLMPLSLFTPSGEQIDNITSWALNKFRKRYGKSVTKDAIFHYVYAALHDPVWREMYAINLKREFPRIPFHDDFAQWAAWGERLMQLHIHYEDVEPWPITREDTDAAILKPKLKPHPEEGRIEIDAATTLTGFPPRAWDYKLGNRSGIDWVLDQHKEKKVRDKTVEAWLQDNPDCRYRFADHKDRVIDLLAKVARVSVETLEIVDSLASASSLQKAD